MPRIVWTGLLCTHAYIHAYIITVILFIVVKWWVIDLKFCCLYLQKMSRRLGLLLLIAALVLAMAGEQVKGQGGPGGAGD